MRILITGSSGQLGAELARQLSQGYEVVGSMSFLGKQVKKILVSKKCTKS